MLQLVGLVFPFSRPKETPIWDRRHQLVGEEMTALWYCQDMVYKIVYEDKGRVRHSPR